MGCNIADYAGMTAKEEPWYRDVDEPFSQESVSLE